MNIEEYLKNPTQCPYCKSKEIEAAQLQVDTNIAWNDVECQSCGKQWRDLYSLTGAEDL